MKRFGRFAARRTFQMVFQVLGMIIMVFFLIRLAPGNPALRLAGPGASREDIRAIEQRLGLDRPTVVQLIIYFRNLSRGDLGNSLITGRTVAHDLLLRLPATLELVTLAMIITIVVGVPLGVVVALRPKGLISKVLFLYGMLAGAIPDFWLALILVYVFFFLLRWAPPPMGRLGLASPPVRVTGLYLVDSLIQGDLATFWLAARQLALPVLTLVIVYMGNITKMAHASMDEIIRSDFIEYARASGLSGSTIIRYALRTALSPVATVVAFNYGYLLGGAVLVESVFSWGGLGEYAVQSLNHSDYEALQGFVLVAALSIVVIYLLLDVTYMILDPRIEQ